MGLTFKSMAFYCYKHTIKMGNRILLGFATLLREKITQTNKFNLI